MARVVDAVEELRVAISELAAMEMQERRQVVQQFQQAAQNRMAELESAARRGLRRLTGE